MHYVFEINGTSFSFYTKGVNLCATGSEHVVSFMAIENTKHNYKPNYKPLKPR